MDARWFTIIGVAPSIRQRRFPEPDPLVYLPLWLDPPVTAALLVRSAQPLSSVGTLIRDQIQRLDENLPSDRVMTVEQFVFESSWNARVSSAILNTIAAIALLLAAVGLYAVTAYSVSTRTQEIGIRIALGANRLDIVSLVSRRVMVHVAIGFAAGVGCTLAWGKLLGGGIGRPDSLAHPATLSIVAVVLVIIGAIAALSPTHRAMRVDPVAALRQE
jgi:ABC-type antimicrobial peptide transport system permease subunit